MKIASRSALTLSTVMVVVAVFCGVALWRNSHDTLAEVHAGISRAYPTVSQISPTEFDEQDAASVLVFDTREESEFAVSHLPGAIRISPDMPAAQFLAEYGDEVSDKIVVFYCSVGARSTQFADKVQSALRDQGAIRVANLELGLFGWHNDNRPLVDGDGRPTQSIHPYNDLWGRLVDNQASVSYGP